MPNHPLAEVFGFPINNQSGEAERYRKLKLCPFNNKVPNCTKDKANAPLGVCSVFDGTDVVITCPIRFRQDWIIAEDAATFFFPSDANWTSLTEVKLKDSVGESAGNIDLVMVSYDANGKLLDFGSLEVQAVYISGNVRRPFEHYMTDPAANAEMSWKGQIHYPGPDYLSSSRKRLAPQLLYKGGILKAWKKKMAVALNRGFFETLPKLAEVKREKADFAWLIYDLILDPASNQYRMHRHKTVYTSFEESLRQITVAKPGDVQKFIDVLQDKLDEKLENGANPPDAPVLEIPD